MSNDATTYRVPGAMLTEREHSSRSIMPTPTGRTITVFTREVAAPDGADRPYLVFLQGGPGFEAARPTSPPTGWMKRALAGLPGAAARPARDRPLDAGRIGDPGRHAARRRPTYLTHFRADSIVRDAELIRRGARASSAGACSARASAASPR